MNMCSVRNKTAPFRELRGMHCLQDKVMVSDNARELRGFFPVSCEKIFSLEKSH